MANLGVILPRVIDSLRRVAPPGSEILPSTPLESIGVDSLGLLEALLDLEATAGVSLSEDVVRRLSLELPADSGLTVEGLARALLQAAGSAEQDG